jgi:hypothetical protein
MRAEITPHTIHEIQENYEVAIEWLDSIGFPVDRGRIVDYKKLINKVSINFDKDGWGGFSDTAYANKFCTALLEVREMISIHQGLKSLNHLDLIANLKHYIKGPYFPNLESASNSSNRARNIGFELYMNALFSSAGLNPKFGTQADLSFNYGNINFFVEAKRPMSEESTPKQINIANKQLKKRYKRNLSFKTKGLIAIDLTKVINPENKFMPVSDTSQLWSLMNNEDTRQINKLKNHWHKDRHKNTIGALLHYRILTNFVGSGDLNTLKWIGMVKFTDDPILDEISEKLSKVIRKVC